MVHLKNSGIESWTFSLFSLSLSLSASIIALLMFYLDPPWSKWAKIHSCWVVEIEFKCVIYFFFYQFSWLIWSCFTFMLICTLGVMNLYFGDLDCVKTSSSSLIRIDIVQGFEVKNGSNTCICKNSMIFFWVSRFYSPEELGIWIGTQELIAKELGLVIVV